MNTFVATIGSPSGSEPDRPRERAAPALALPATLFTDLALSKFDDRGDQLLSMTLVAIAVLAGMLHLFADPRSPLLNAHPRSSAPASAPASPTRPPGTRTRRATEFISA